MAFTNARRKMVHQREREKRRERERREIERKRAVKKKEKSKVIRPVGQTEREVPHDQTRLVNKHEREKSATERDLLIMTS